MTCEKTSPYKHQIDTSSTEARKGLELGDTYGVKMWGRQIRPKVELLSSLQSEGASTENSKDK